MKMSKKILLLLAALVLVVGLSIYLAVSSGQNSPPESTQGQNSANCNAEASTDAGGGLSKCDVEHLDNADTDRDGINDPNDNCAGVANSNQKDSDLNGMGDACQNLKQ